MNILEVQDLCKTYGKGEAAVQALRHATFSVRKGEFIAIIGESGSGKSTLLNVVGALDKATSGKVWIDGQDIFSMLEKKLTVFRRQHIGFIFQSFNLIPELNVEQNISTTAGLVLRRASSKRFSTVMGRITLPYSWGLNRPTRWVAICQIRSAFALILASVCFCSSCMDIGLFLQILCFLPFNYRIAHFASQKLDFKQFSLYQSFLSACSGNPSL